jgi:hypothetical protein
MCGFNGNTSIIKAWGVVVYNNNPLFGLAASQAIQKNWEWFDAQQAMTMNYLVERCNSSSLSRLVPEKMERWRAYRLDQLALLRGMVKTTDIHYSIDVQTQRASSYLTLLKILPAGVLIDLETQVMWALNVGSPVRQDIFWNNQGKDNTSGQAMWAANSAVRPSGCTLGTSYATKTAAEYWFFFNSGQCVNWRIPKSDELLKLMTKCGGQVGGSGADRFQAAMQGKGFNFPSGQVRLWTSSTSINYGDCPNGRCDPNPHYQVLVEGDDWWNPASKADDTAMVVYCRNLQPGEADLYYYQTS